MKRSDSAAWHVCPGTYLESRRRDYSLTPPRSHYVTMRDGCRLALDVYLPEPKGVRTGDETFPALLFFTPYYRRFKMAPGGTGEVNPNTGKFRDFFVPHGYAVVVVDVRGTGASFGTRDSFRSPKEREDSAEIADWVVAQPWSSGRIGATGISYLGAASDFLASTGHPAVKAIAPLFSVWDTYADNYFPGGIHLKALTQIYDDMMIGLDHDRRDLLKDFSYFNNPHFIGPQPVDGDEDGTLVQAAIQEHMGNFRHPDFMPEFKFREEGLPYDQGFSSASFSPYATADGIKSDVAILSVSGWRDGAGYMNGAISRFLTLKDNPRHLLLGPWDHGARIDVSPWRETVEATFPWMGEVLRFFDTYLMGRDTGLAAEAPIHYFVMHAEEWRSAAQWPPVKATRSFHAAPGEVLEDTPPATLNWVSHKVDFTMGTGLQTRYERIAGVDSRDYYTDWGGRGERMVNFTSAPLKQALELIGHGRVDLILGSSEPDAALFVYLTEVEEDGTERYVTEGLLRALHRKESPAPVSYQTTWPFRTFRREDAKPLVPGEIERIRIPLLPVGWRFTKGSRIRLSLAGADVDHCAQVPHGRPPVLSLGLGGDGGTLMELPLVPVEPEAEKGSGA